MKIKYKSGKGEKVHIYVDNQYSFTTDLNTFYSLNLHENEEIDEEKLTYIKEKVDFSYLYNSAIKILSLRAHSEKELKDKLLRKNRASYIVDDVIYKIKEQKYLDDQAFAVAYIKELFEQKKKSKNFILFKLKQKGISENVVHQILSEYDVDEKDRIKKIIEEKYGKIQINDEKNRRRIYNFLVRAGFDVGDILSALNEMGEK